MSKKIVIKIGTGVITDENGKLDEEVVSSIVSQVCALLRKGLDVLLVSSGAIGAGMGLLGKDKRSNNLAELQSMASIGQVHLMDVYNKYFKKNKYHAGQILLTQEDFDNRQRFLNMKYTINTLLKHNAVPVINENDTISTDEIKCGDNDRISALVADVVEADMLIILTTVDGLLDEKGKTVKAVDIIDKDIHKLIRQEKTKHGTGGMATKLEAADFATKAGIECVFANGKKKNKIIKVIEGKQGCYTRFKVKASGVKAKKRWIGFTSKVKGILVLDKGASQAVRKNNKSLLAAGVKDVSGTFKSGDIVSIVDQKDKEIARGMTNYTSKEISKIKGVKTSEINKVLGYKDHDEVIHKDNLVIVN